MCLVDEDARDPITIYCVNPLKQLTQIALLNIKTDQRNMDTVASARDVDPHGPPQLIHLVQCVSNIRLWSKNWSLISC